MNVEPKNGHSQPPDSPLNASRGTDVEPVPTTSLRPFVREMERPRTESYGELWQRASIRMRRF